jgi:hypothetical protein
VKVSRIVCLLICVFMVSSEAAISASESYHHSYERKSNNLIKQIKQGNNSNAGLSTSEVIRRDGWLNYIHERIHITGAATVMGILGNHDPAGSFSRLHSSSDIFVNNANLFIGVDVNKWSKFNLSAAYLGQPNEWYSTSDSYAINQDVKYHNIFADEAYITLADFFKYPLFVKAGKLYLPFGSYGDKYIPWQIESPAQMLSQTNSLAIILGSSSSSGVYGSIFALKGQSIPRGIPANNIRNWGGEFGYHGDKVNLSAGYIRNVWDSYVFAADNGIKYKTEQSPYYRAPVGGVSLHADLSHEFLNINANWVGTLSDMNQTYYNAPDYSGNSKFWGADINAAYLFNTLGHNSSLGAGWQMSGNGRWLSGNTTPLGKLTVGNPSWFVYIIPKWRLLGEYKISLFKNTDLGLIFAHGKGYDISTVDLSQLSTGVSNIGLVSLGIKF